jgi:hypothetical protein
MKRIALWVAEKQAEVRGGKDEDVTPGVGLE